MNKPVALAVALSLAACGQNLTPEEIRHAMPTSGVLAITAPEPGGATMRLAAGAGPALAVAPAPGDPSPLAVSSWLLATAVNGGVFWTLAPIAWFTQVVPPTKCDADACTWGPGSGANELNVWKLVVARKGDGYEYSLFGAPKSSGGTTFVTVLHGLARPGALPHRGHGGFRVEMDTVWAGLDHAAGEAQKDFGTLEVTYDARAGVALHVDFLNARNGEDPGADPANPNRLNAAYDFAASAAGGDLQVGWRTLPAGATERTMALHTRWLSTGASAGAGRADAAATAPGGSAAYSQCWDGPPGHPMTFDGLLGTGLESACVFPTAAPPTIVVP
jgi:hypothetical protein